MNEERRYAALRLRALAPEDSAWILARLPEGEAEALRALMTDPRAASLAAVADLLEPPVAPRALIVPKSEAPSPQEFGGLDDMDAAWAAAWLHVRPGDVASHYLATAPAARVTALTGAMAVLPPLLPERMRNVLVGWDGGRRQDA